MPTNIPFVPGVRDDSQSTARISDLIRMRGSQQADAIAQAGAQSGQMWSDAGRNIGSMVSDLVRMKAYEDEQRAIREARTRDIAVQDAVRLTPRDEQTGRLDPERIADEVARIDPVKALDWWRKADDQTKAQLVAERAQTETAAKAAGSLLATLKRTDPAEHQPIWTAARTKALDDGLLASADQMPEQVDMSWLQQTFDQARSISDIARELQSIGEQEDGYTLGPGQVRFAGGKEVARGPEKTAEPARAGTFEALVDDLANEKGAPLSTAEVLTARRQWTDAGRRPPSADSPMGVSQAQRAAAERWKQNELRSAENVFAEATKDLDREAFPEDEATWTQALGDLEESKRQIQLSYLEQIQSTDMPLPEDARRRATTPPRGAPGSPAGGRPAAAAPGGPPSMRSMASQASPQQRAIEEMLQAEGPGKYELDDGSSWLVTPEGHVERLGPGTPNTTSPRHGASGASNRSALAVAEAPPAKVTPAFAGPGDLFREAQAANEKDFLAREADRSLWENARDFLGPVVRGARVGDLVLAGKNRYRVTAIRPDGLREARLIAPGGGMFVFVDGRPVPLNASSRPR